MQKMRFLGALVIAVALATALFWFFGVPAPEGVEESPLYSQFGTPLTLADAVVALGGAALCIFALRNFKKELRPAYLFIAFSQLILALGAFFYFYVEYNNFWDNVWYNFATYLSYFFGSILLYLGVRRFYRILQLQSRFTSLMYIFGAAVIITVIRAFLPHNDVWGYLGLSELQYDLFEFLVVVPAVCYGAATYLTFRLRRKLGAEYYKAFTALGIGVGLLFLSSINVVVLELVGYDNEYALSRLYIVPMVIGDLGILFAAVRLSMIGLPYEKSLWQRLFGKQRPPVTSFDILVYVAGLHSDPAKLDPYLDRMRSISANVGTSSGSLNAQQQEVLKGVYLNVERSLASDTLRRFTAEEIREDVRRRFFNDGDNGSQTFWPQLGAQQPA